MILCCDVPLLIPFRCVFLVWDNCATSASTESTIHSEQDWTTLAKTLNEYRTECQQNPAYSILRDSEAMKARVAQMIELPDLPGKLTPKGFEDSTARKTFLLTKQRYDLYKETDTFLSGKSTWTCSYGFVPSGPFGIGKSAIGLLLACSAFVRGHFVLYTVRESRSRVSMVLLCGIS